MCTAITYKTNNFYFGRTLDYEFSFGEEITVVPRKFSFAYRNGFISSRHYAIIGMAHIADNYPLYYDAVNEKGLCMAGLNFVGNAVYRESVQGKDNIAYFELIPWILGQCATVKEAKDKLGNINITATAFNDELLPAQLHWLIADKKESIVVESVEEGIVVYDNPMGVLTNNPPFDMQKFFLNNYMGLTAKAPQNRFCQNIHLAPYSRGMGALGLPGDLSSPSRFVRAAFTKLNSATYSDEKHSVGQFFHILGTVEQVSGCCELENGEYEKTIYTCCINADKGIYYYTTYGNRQITAVNMHRLNLERECLVRYKLINDEQIKIQN